MYIKTCNRTVLFSTQKSYHAQLIFDLEAEASQLIAFLVIISIKKSDISLRL